MVQKIFGIGIAGTGIVGVLIATGFISSALNVQTGVGNLAAFAGVGIGIMLGLLGIFGVAKRVLG